MGRSRSACASASGAIFQNRSGQNGRGERGHKLPVIGVGALSPDYRKWATRAELRGVARRSQVVLRTGRLVGGAVKETTGLDASMIPSSSSARQTRLLVVRAKHPRLQFGEAPIHLEFPGLERLPLRGAFARLSMHFEQAALRVYEPVSFGDQVIP